MVAGLTGLLALGSGPTAMAQTSGPAWDESFSAAISGGIDPAVRIGVVDPTTGAVTVGGEFSSPNGGIARFAADGSPDTAFNAAAGPLSPTYAMARDEATGALTVGGAFSAPSTGLARLNPDGSPDTAFNAAVGATLDGGAVTSLAVDPATGAITVGGSFTSPSHGLARFLADGSPDTAFNAAIGTVLASGAVSSLVLTPSGGVIVGGTFTSPGSHLARFDPSGTLDASLQSTLDGAVFALATAPDGSLIVGGQFNSPSNRLARFSPSGAPDTAFDATAGSAINGVVSEVAIDAATGDITIGGSFTSPGQRIARLSSSGQPDTDFNTSQVATTLNGTAFWIDPASGMVGGGFTTPGSRLARMTIVTVALAPIADQSGLVGTAITPVTATATTTGGALSYAATGLPPGLTIAAATGQITGTPTASGTYPVTVQATSSGITDSTAFTWQITSAPTISGTAPDGRVGEPYDFQYTLGGDPLPTASVSAGSLPPGLILDPDGRLHGTPTTGGLFSADITALGAGGQTATIAADIRINAEPTIAGEPPAALAGAPYDWRFTTGGYPAPTVTLADGALPDGLVLDATGRLHGTPTGAGSFEFDVAATNSQGSVELGGLVLSVTGPSVTVTRSQVAAGGDQTVLGSGFVPGEEVPLVLTSDPVAVGTAIADADGRISLTFIVPADTPAGTHTVTTTSRGGVSTAAFTVTAAPPGGDCGGGAAGGPGTPGTGGTPSAGGPGAPCGAGSGGRLPVTGADSGGLALLGGVFLLTGGLLLRRRSTLLGR